MDHVKMFLTNGERIKPIISKCEEQLEAGRDFIIMALMYRDPPQGETTMLFGHRGPRGEVLNYVPEHRTIAARFKASKVRDALLKELER